MSQTNTWFYNCKNEFPKFKPLWWGSTPFIQCALHQSEFGLPKIRWSSTYINLPDGVLCRLDHVKPTIMKSKGIIIVFHGLGGSSESSYCKVIAKYFGGEYNVIIFNRRAHVAESVSKQIPTHYDKNDFDCVMNYIKSIANGLPIYGIGFSLGSMLMLKYIADTKDNCIFTKAVSCGNFWDCELATSNLKDPYWIKKLGEFADDVYRYVEDSEDFLALHSLQQKDELVIKKKNFGGNLSDYYKSFSSIFIIDDISIPVVCLDSLDDPIFVYPHIMDIIHRNKNLSFIHTSHGGHTCWIEGIWPRSAYYCTVLKTILI